MCSHYCAEGAIEFGPAVAGHWFVSDTRFGPMLHARLGVGAENSGKLVTLIRQIAEQSGGCGAPGRLGFAPEFPRKSVSSWKWWLNCF